MNIVITVKKPIKEILNDEIARCMQLPNHRGGFRREVRIEKAIAAYNGSDESEILLRYQNLRKMR